MVRIGLKWRKIAGKEARKMQVILAGKTAYRNHLNPGHEWASYSDPGSYKSAPIAARF